MARRKKRDDKERVFLAITIFLLVFGIVLFLKPLVEFTSHFIFEPKAVLQDVGISLSIDATPPEVTIFSPENDTYLDNSIDLNYTAYDKVVGIDTVWYSIDDGTNTTLAGNVTLTSLNDGTHKVFVYANDSGNQVNATEFVIFAVSETTEVIFTEFDIFSTTNFSNLTNTQLEAITNLTLEVPQYGKIVFGETVNISGDINIDANLEISYNFIELDSGVLSNFNKSATLYLYNLTFANPRILRNGALCPDDFCEELNYSGNNLTFSVVGFTNYSVEETPVEGVLGGAPGGGGSAYSKISPIEIEPTPEPEPKLKPIHEKGDFFDVLLTIPEKYLMLFAGEELIAEIGLININKIGTTSVVIEYSIGDKNNNVIFSEYETRDVNNGITYLKKILLPPNIKPEDYMFKIVVKYGDDAAIAGFPFTVNEKRVEKPGLVTKDYAYLLILILIVVISISLFKVRGIKVELRTSCVKKKRLKRILVFCGLLVLLLFVISINYKGYAVLSVDTNIPSKYENLAGGEDILIESEIIMLNQANEIVDVEIEYTITDSKNSEIYKVIETKGGNTRIVAVKEITIPFILEPGIYSANVKASYGGSSRSDSDNFEVVKQPFFENRVLNLNYSLIFVILALFLLFFGFILWERARFKRIELAMGIKKICEKDLYKKGLLKRKK